MQCFAWLSVPGGLSVLRWQHLACGPTYHKAGRGIVCGGIGGGHICAGCPVVPLRA